MSKIIGYDSKNKPAVTDGVIARHWSIFYLLMLADITSVSRDIVQSRVRVPNSDSDRTSSAGSKDALTNRLLTNIINMTKYTLERYMKLLIIARN